MMANWRQQPSNSNKSSPGWPKRQLSRDLSSNDTNNNPSGRWFQTSFTSNSSNNNKRARSDVSQGDLGSVTIGLNHLTTNSSPKMDDENPFDDDLDEFLTQATFVPGQGFTQTQPTQHPPPQTNPNARPVTNAISSINTSQTSNNEMTEGRLKILESQKKNLADEVSKLKGQMLVSNKKMNEMNCDYDVKLEKLKQKYESELTFMHSENKTQQQMLDQMQTILNKLPPNTPLHIFVNMMTRGKNCPTFSQLKLQEFYGGLNPSTSGMATSSVTSSQMSTGVNMYVAGSQQSVAADNSIHNLPSQIGPTQMTPSPMSVSVAQTTSSGPESMDTTSVHSNQSTIRSQVSQSQSKRSFWDTIQPKLEEKFNKNRQELDQLLLGQQIDLFDNQWLRNIQELNQLAASLNGLSLQLSLQIVDF